MMEFNDLSTEMQEAAQYILGPDIKDKGRVYALADILFALHTLKEQTHVDSCATCGEAGIVIRIGVPVYCKKHEPPFCQEAGCCNRTIGKGFCKAHHVLHRLKKDVNPDLTIWIDQQKMTLKDFLEE